MTNRSAARSGTFVAVHAVDESLASQPARAKALSVGERCGEFVGVHADHHGLTMMTCNASEPADGLPAHMRSKIRKERRMMGLDLLSGALAGMTKAELATLLDLQWKDVDKALKGLAPFGVEFFVLLAERKEGVAVEVVMAYVKLFRLGALKDLAKKLAAEIERREKSGES